MTRADVVLVNPYVERIEEMSSAKQLAISLFTVATACAFASPMASAAANLVVNDDSQVVQTPMAPASGISYVQSGANTSTLKIYTEGFLFCANGPGAITREATLQPAHEDQTFVPAHPWSFPSVVDVYSVAYSGSTLGINSNNETTLTCQGTGASGEVTSGLSDGIFDNGLDSATEINYTHLINWIPTARFTWMAPDWAAVPTDPCSSSTNQPARVVEDVACAAVTGTRNGGDAPVRSPTIWTFTDGVNFTYLFRVDGRFGPEQPPQQMHVPSLERPTTADALTVEVRDAFDSTFLSANGQWCLLTQLPSTLSSGVCTGQTTHPLDASQPFVSYGFAANPAPQPSEFSYYVAVTRSIAGAHSNLDTPVVGVAVITDPVAVSEGGNKFSGDDTIFGFMPTSTGFPWMTGQ